MSLFAERRANELEAGLSVNQIATQMRKLGSVERQIVLRQIVLD